MRYLTFLSAEIELPRGDDEVSGYTIEVQFGVSRAQRAKQRTNFPLVRVEGSETVRGDVPGAIDVLWGLLVYLDLVPQAQLSLTVDTRRWKALTRKKAIETLNWMFGALGQDTG